MPTYTEIAYDILSTMGYSTDDANRHLESLLYNMEVVINRLQRQRLEKEFSMTGDRGSTDTMTTYIVPLFAEDYVDGRTYFNLPSAVHDIRQNGGISYICYVSGSGCPDNLVGKHFTLATPAEVDGLDGSAFQKPRPAMPYYYRARINTGTTTFTDRVWLLGPGPTVNAVEVGLYLAVDLSNPITDPNVKADIPSDMVYLVKRMVLEMERFALLVPQEELKNEGRGRPLGSPTPQVPHMSSVNDPINLSEQ